MGCGCGSVGLTRGLAVVGILVSGLCIAPVAYAYFGAGDLSLLLPFMRPVQEKLREEFRRKTITQSSLADLQSLLEGVANNVTLGSLLIVTVASANVFVEIILLGCPTVIFFSLLGVYLLRQGLLLPAVLSF